jgi:hypothetical protein
MKCRGLQFRHIMLLQDYPYYTETLLVTIGRFFVGHAADLFTNGLAVAFCESAAFGDKRHHEKQNYQ